MVRTAAMAVADSTGAMQRAASLRSVGARFIAPIR
jgi:hypothetical protein